MLSPTRMVTAPPACIASLPVVIVTVCPPTTVEKDCSLSICSFLHWELMGVTQPAITLCGAGVRSYPGAPQPLPKGNDRHAHDACDTDELSRHYDALGENTSED